MDINLLKNKLNAINSSGKKQGTGEKIDYTQYFWKPQPGKHQIRILPSKFDKSNPFREVFFHYGFTKGPVLALNNWGESDPIIEFSSKLKATRDKDNYLLAKKLEPKMRVFVPVIVRGEEDKGTRLWEFGKEIYKTLLGVAADEDYGDFTDITDGRDFTIEAVEDVVAGRKGVKCNIRVKPKTSAISEDAVIVEKAINEDYKVCLFPESFTFKDINEAIIGGISKESIMDIINKNTFSG